MVLTADQHFDDGPTDAQDRTIAALDDALEHLAHEFDREDYRGPSTCGFGRITDLDGRGSLVRGVKSVAQSDRYPQITTTGRQDDRYLIEIAGFTIQVSPNHDSGYSLSVTDFPTHYDMGADYQRLDVQERVHRLILNRLQSYWGLAENARVYRRVD